MNLAILGLLLALLHTQPGVISATVTAPDGGPMRGAIVTTEYLVSRPQMRVVGDSGAVAFVVPQIDTCMLFVDTGTGIYQSRVWEPVGERRDWALGLGGD